MRGATCLKNYTVFILMISTHTPHAGRDQFGEDTNMMAMAISTHTPHAGRDYEAQEIDWGDLNFYSHAPCGARHLLHQ